MSASQNVVPLRREPPTDLELVERYKASEDLAILGELYERYTHLVLGVALRYLRNREDAEDAVIEVFERLISALKKHRVDNFKNWLYSVVINHCRMSLRKRNTQPRAVEASEELLDAVLASAGFPSAEEDPDADLGRLRAALSRLNEGQRRCVELFYLEGKSYVEVVDATGYELGQVKSHIQNGKRNLRILLTEA